jgi:hypothetical protein
MCASRGGSTCEPVYVGAFQYAVGFHLAGGLEHNLVHHAKDQVIRLDHARIVEVLANFAEHVATPRIDRARSKGVRVSLGVLAYQAQFFGGPHAKELVPANRRFQIVEAGHPIFPITGSRPETLRSAFPLRTKGARTYSIRTWFMSDTDVQAAE